MKKFGNIVFFAMMALGLFIWVKDLVGGSSRVEQRNNSREIQEIAENDESCGRLEGATAIFIEEVSRSIKIPQKLIKIGGATYGTNKVGLSHCMVYISTPHGSFLCSPYKILSDDGGRTTYAQGFSMPDARAVCEER